MYNYIHPKNDNKGIGGAIVGGVGQVVGAYNLKPANQAASGPPPVSPGSPDSKSPNPSPTFRPKGRMDRPAVGPPKDPATTTTNKPTNPPPKQGN